MRSRFFMKNEDNFNPGNYPEARDSSGRYYPLRLVKLDLINTELDNKVGPSADGDMLPTTSNAN